MLTSVMVLAAGLPAVWIDARTHRIPNVLVGLVLLAALSAQAAYQGAAGIGLSLAGAAVGLAAFLPIYFTGAMGAGDVKLMAAFGALLGLPGAVHAVILTLIAGSGLALATLGWRRWVHLEAPSAGNPGTPAGRMPYAGAIVAGCLIASLITA